MLTMNCPHCDARLRVKPDLAGRSVKCPKCQQPMTLPNSDVASSAVPDDSVLGGPPANDPAPNPKVRTPLVTESLPTRSSEPEFTTGASDGFRIDSTAAPAVSSRRKSSNGVGLAVGVTVVLAILGGVIWFLRPTDGPVDITVQELPTQTIPEGRPFSLKLPTDSGRGGPPTLTLISGPQGATVNSATRSFEWTPTEADGPGDYAAAVRVTQGSAAIEGRFQIRVTEFDSPPVFDPVSTVSTRPEQPVQIQFIAKDPDLPGVGVRYSLGEVGHAFQSAKLDSKTGEFLWTPSELLSQETVTLDVVATEDVEAGLTTLLEVPIQIQSFSDPVRQLVADLRKQSLSVRMITDDTPGVPVGFQGDSTGLSVNDAAVTVFSYASSADLQAELSQVDAGSSQVLGQPWEHEQPLTLMQRDQFIVATQATDTGLLSKLSEVFDPPVAVVKKYEPPPTVVKETPRLVKELLPLYEEQLKRPGKPRKLFTTEAYKPVRKLFADEFAQAHEVDIKAGLGLDYDEVMEWFASREDFREELYTAIDPERDDVVGVFQVFNQLRKDFPKQIDKYGSLAIATAVVWDEEGHIYNYDGHARRTHSTLPSTLLNGHDNFRYFVEAEGVMEGRAQYVPWEFLVHLVNHNTPAAERMWALQGYLPSRPMFGKCYSDVPYDSVMLQTESKVCRLAGMEYTLPNIRQFGGVCAMQADFAARVGKSLGVPAAYVGGQGRYGGAHAWVMWVELKSITPRAVSFALESHGRYQGDHYYVGNLKDPQTGRGMTDRLLELRLHQVGVDALAKRHSLRIMQLFPALAEELQLDLAGRLDYLTGAVNLNPWSEAAWNALSKLSAGQELDQDQRKAMAKVLDQLFINFAPFPDFSLTVFRDLIAFEPDAPKRIAFYYRLLEIYAAAQRPDLAFAGLLELSDVLEQEGRTEEAIQALAAAIQKYAVEGQYIPKMLDRLEALAADKGGTEQTLATFYAAFLPKIPQKRGSEPSDYCIAMYQRAVPIFEKAGLTQAAQTYAAAALQLKGNN